MRPPSPADLRARLASPATQTDLLQVLKAVVAAVVSWVITEEVLDLHQAFLAPWVALLTVHATVHRTLWRGVQTVLAVGVGVVLSLVVVLTMGSSSWSLGVALLVGLLLARLPLVRDEGVTIATTALFVIAAGYDASEQQAVAFLPDRLLATGIGVVVALLVNAVVLPPLNDASAQRQVDDVDRRLGDLIVKMAGQMRHPWQEQQEDDWVEETRSIDEDVDHAWSLVRHSQESRAWNVRRRRHRGLDDAGYPEVLTRLEEGVSYVRAIARQTRESSREAHEWDPVFRDRFVDLLEEAGRRVADPDAQVADLRQDLESLVRDLSREDLPALRWPLYGALLANLRLIVEIVDDVATARPVRT
ncbi:FUSC family protein [Phycicoccus sp. BSK3Z-2]|uniref:FUSC family protein n=1 Tax=Phycicoccus avicenniae TaxID=2828860 RepID=A0A941HZA9_9MICO|nr:aromatic acid exporter family protein [Phycicoccus avicenniae]MBR7742730.1 FUSC family protein [Phycicoccus avicenniae]